MARARHLCEELASVVVEGLVVEHAGTVPPQLLQGLHRERQVPRAAAPLDDLLNVALPCGRNIRDATAASAFVLGHRPGG